MALAKVLERVLESGNSYGGLLPECFTSFLEASVRLKEMEDEEDEVDEDEDAESDEENEDETEDEVWITTQFSSSLNQCHAFFVYLGS